MSKIGPKEADTILWPRYLVHFDPVFNRYIFGVEALDLIDSTTPQIKRAQIPFSTKQNAQKIKLIYIKNFLKGESCDKIVDSILIVDWSRGKFGSLTYRYIFLRGIQKL